MIHGASFPIPNELVAPGAPYETIEGRLGDKTCELFRNAPPTLSQRLAETFAARRAMPEARMTEQDGAVTSFGQFEARAAALSAHLQQAMGVKPGDNVAIAMANRMEWMLSFVAIVAAGAAPVLVNSRGAGAEMRRAVEMTDCVAVIADSERQTLLVAENPLALPFLVIGADPDSPDNFDAASMPDTDGQLVFAPRDADDPAIILFSSGTTGHPKAIVHSQGGMGHSMTLGLLLDEAYDALYRAHFGVDPYAGLGAEPPAIIVSSPLFHVAGLLLYLRAIMKGGATVLLGKWNTDAVFDLLEANTIVRLALVPTMIFDLLASPRAAGGALSRLRFLSSGTAALAPEVAARIRQALPQCFMLNTYGQTETMERVATFGGPEFEANLAAVGRVVPTTMLRVVRDDGSDAEPGEPGEVAAFGACTMAGYYNDPEATASTIRDGWVLSGDIGRFDEDGLLHIVDRKKNMVIAGGENIYCAEVERVMAEHPAVAEAMAFGEPDARLGERLVAVAVLKPGQTLGEDEMKAHCREGLAIYKVPRAIGFIDAPLPRNATGKVAKGEFLAGYERPWAEAREGEVQA